jgi:hypothetical protein
VGHRDRGLPANAGRRRFTELVTYQRASDGRPRIAAGSEKGHLFIWDGDDFSILQAIPTDAEESPIHSLAVYEEPTSGRARLVTG